jgi:hypothetical protein
MGINQVLLEGRVTTEPRRKSAKGNLFFEFVLARKDGLSGAIERFVIVLDGHRATGRAVKRSDDVLVLGHLKEERSKRRTRTTIRAMRIVRLSPLDGPSSIAVEDLREVLGGDDISF